MRLSAGGVVLNQQGEVLIVEQRGGSYSFPKGGIEAGESVEDAARREINQEAGITELKFQADLGEYQRTNLVTGEMKQIHLLLFTAGDQTPTHVNDPDPESATQGAWFVPFEKALELLSHPMDKQQLLNHRHDIKAVARWLADQQRLGG